MKPFRKKQENGQIFDFFFIVYAFSKDAYILREKKNSIAD